MPIEIRELVIRVAVGEAPAGAEASAQTGVGEGKGKEGAVVDECVDQVMEILDRREER